MELLNSKVTQIEPRRFLGKYFLLPVQMSDDGKVWQDIKPHLIRDIDGWHIEDAPYYAEVKDDGARLFCPDRNTRSTYLSLPSINLIRNLSKNIISHPATLDEQLQPSQVSMPTTWGELRIIFRNDGLFFHILFNQAPPVAMKDRIILDVNSANIDIAKALSARTGWKIPRPRLVGSNSINNIPVEKFVDWSFKNGQLELGFDFTGLTFPILLMNTTYTIGVGTDDASQPEVSGDTTTTANGIYCVASATAATRRWVGLRFTGVLPSKGSTAVAGYITVTETGSAYDDCNFSIYCQDAAGGATFTDGAGNFDISGRTLTTQVASWVQDSIASPANSPAMGAVLQEIVTDYTLTSICVILKPKTDAEKWLGLKSYESPSGSATLTMTWTEPVGGGWANIKNARPGTGVITATDLSSIWFGTTEVAVADIAEIPVGVSV